MDCVALAGPVEETGAAFLEPASDVAPDLAFGIVLGLALFEIASEAALAVAGLDSKSDSA